MPRNKLPSDGQHGGNDAPGDWNLALAALGFSDEFEWATEVVNATQRRIASVVHSNDVDDVKQKVLIAAWMWLIHSFEFAPDDRSKNRAHYFKGLMTMTAWIAGRHAKRERSLYIPKEVTDDIASIGGVLAAVHPLLAAEEVLQLRNAIKKLAPDERAVVELVVSSGKSIAWAGSMLQIPKYMAYARYARGLSALQQLLLPHPV